MHMVIVVTDLHGNYPLYKRFKDLSYDKLIILGDLIDCNGNYEDESVKILDDIKSEKEKEIIVLDSNHQSAHFRGGYLFENNSLLVKEFKKNIRKYHNGKLQPYYDEYMKMMKSFPLYYITKNKFFFSHAGPATTTSKNKIFDYTSFLWNYIDEVSENNIEEFCNIHNFKGIVVGHNHINYETKNKLLTFNSLNGYYLNLDEDKNIEFNDLIDLVFRLKK